MRIKTKFFGEIEFDESEIIFFPFGIYGFEDDHRFVLIYDDQIEDGISSFMWLQSADNSELCFIVVDPCAIMSEYKPRIPGGTVYKLGANDESALRFLVLTVIYEETEKSTVNTLSPIVINAEKNTAMQVILENNLEENKSFMTRQLLFCPAGCENGDRREELC